MTEGAIVALLEERISTFVLALDGEARHEGNLLLLANGGRVFLKGLKRGFVEQDGEEFPLLELAMRMLNLSRESALEYCEFVLAEGDGEAPATRGEFDPMMRTPEDYANAAELERLKAEFDAADAEGARAEMELVPYVPAEEKVKVTPPKNGAQRDSFLPDIRRLLPQSGEAEMGVLCSLLLAPCEVGDLCNELGVTVEWFHIPAHREIYEQLMFMHGERMPCDVIILTNMLRDQKRLDAVGGPAFIMEVSGFLPTAANARYYVEILEQKYTLRELIRRHTEFAARAYDEQDEVTRLVDESERSIVEIGARRYEQSLSALLDGRAFDQALPPPEPPPIYKLGEWIIATPENIVMLQAKVKAGKTAGLGGMIASTMEPTGDCLGFFSENPQGLALIHFDTEQSKFHHHMVLDRALHRAGRRVPPLWLFSYYVKGLGVAQLMAALKAEMKRRARQCGGIHSVILDGIGDFCMGG